jgi:drug/metabolite transporter superfamily protein YnfA
MAADWPWRSGSSVGKVAVARERRQFDHCDLSGAVICLSGAATTLLTRAS